MTESILHSLERLSISNDDFDESLRVFDPHHVGHTSFEKINSILLKSSKDPRLARIVFDQLQNNPENFFKGLRKVEDGNVILVSIISINEKPEPICFNLLSHLRKLLLQSTGDPNSTKDYLSYYLCLSSNFEAINTQHIGALLQLFGLSTSEDVKVSQEINSLLLLILIRAIKSSTKEAATQISDYIDILLDEELSTYKFLNLVKVLESLFPIVPAITCKYYMDEKVKQAILNQVNEKGHSVDSLSNNRQVITEILKLVSVSCINDQCRTFNVDNYLGLLQLGTKVDLEEIKVLSCLDLVKLWNFIKLDKDKSGMSIDSLYDTFAGYLLTSSTECLEYIIEALAYLTINSSIQSKMRSQESLIETLVSLLKESETGSTITYGLILIFSNLSKLKDKTQSKERQTVNYLKNYSQPGALKPGQSDDAEVTLFNKSLLIDHRIISVIAGLKTYKGSTDNSNIINQVVSIIYNISFIQDKQVRLDLIKQGALNLTIDYLIKHSSVTPTGETRPADNSEDKVEVRLFALRALCRMLISLNPQLAFKKHDIRTSLPFLIELLGPDIGQYEGQLVNLGADQYLHEKITTLDKFESLLALTNISSIEDSPLKKVIIGRTFDKYLDNFIIDTEVPEIQQASWELVSNLISEPTLLVKFFNINEAQLENWKRLTLLIKLLNSKSTSLQITIAGLLANATSEFEMISNVILEHDEVLQELLGIVIEIFENESTQEDLIHRVLYTLYNLAFVAKENGELQKLTREDLVKSFGAIMKSSKNQEILSITVEIIKLFK